MILRYVTNGNDRVSRLIRAGEHGFWATHVEALIEDKLVGAHWDGGVQARPRDYDADQWAVQLFVRLDASDDTNKMFESAMLSQIGKKYDMAIIAALALDSFIGEREWGSSDAWICSELVHWALERCGWHGPLATSTNHVTPRDSLLIISSHVLVEDPEKRILKIAASSAEMVGTEAKGMMTA